MFTDININPFQFKIISVESTDENQESKQASTWLIAPYFLIYFVTYLVNFLVWPLLIMERICVDVNKLNVTFSFQIDVTANSSALSCINKFMAGNNFTDDKAKITTDLVNSDTLYVMIIGSVGSAVLSLISYFAIWKQTLANCQGLAAFLPPICVFCQCVLYSYALTIEDIATFKYTMIAAMVLPSIHCNFQGIFLLFYSFMANPDGNSYKQKRDIVSTKIDLTHAVVFASIIFAGMFISVAFDMSYTVIFVMLFTLTILTALYAFILTPITVSCFKSKEDVDKKKDERETESCPSSEEEEAMLLTQNARKSKDRGLLSNKGNLFSEAPMIFSETSYRKELIVIIELSIFTVAVIADANLSGPYLLQSPFRLTVREYGYCIAAQGVSKIIGMLLLRLAIYFRPIRHSSIISIAALNYIVYYIVLAVIPSGNYIYISLLINIFGGVAIPTLISFMKINFTDTIDTVLEISTIGSLIVTVGFSSIEYFVYMKTRNIFPGIIFLITAGLILLGFVVVMATFFSSTIRNKRRTKDFADRLLNDYH